MLRTISALRTVFCLAVVVSVSKVQSAPGSCRQGYDRCFRSYFADTVASFNITVSLSDVLPSWNVTVLPLLCSDYEQFSSCISTVSCSLTDSLILEGIDAAWRYLCNDTSPGAAYYNYSVCYREPSVVQGAAYCNNTFSTKIDRLGNIDTSNDISLACKYYDEYVSCTWASVNAACGPSAANWQQLYVVNQLTPYVSDILECSDWGSNGSADNGEDDSSLGGILVTIFVALSLLLMLFIVVALAVIVARRRAKYQSSSRSTTASNDVQETSDAAPPNYSEPYVVIEQTTPTVAATSGTTDDSGHQEPTGESNGGVGPQYRIQLIDPLTGRRTDRGVVSSNEFPLKTWPTALFVPPPYDDQPPPSFSGQLGSDAVGREAVGGVDDADSASTGVAVATSDNYGFCPDDEDKPKIPE